MNEAPTRTLASLLDKDLAGWRLTRAHFLELEHGLWGTFPALIVDTDEAVICLDKTLLKEVGQRLSPRRYKVTTFRALANETEGIAFSLEAPCGLETEIVHLMTRAQFNQLVAASDKPFRWAPGLVGNDMDKDEFLETLKVAQREGPP